MFTISFTGVFQEVSESDGDSSLGATAEAAQLSDESLDSGRRAGAAHSSFESGIVSVKGLLSLWTILETRVIREAVSSSVELSNTLVFASDQEGSAYLLNFLDGLTLSGV